MKQTWLAFLSILIGLAFLFPAFAYGKNTLRPEKQTRTTKMRVKVKGKADLTGRVVQVNIPGNTLSIRHGGVFVSFDISNPVLMGYKSIDQIKSGDHVAVSYTGNITKIAKVGSIPYASITKKPPRIKRGASTPKKGGPVRIRERTSGRDFSDVDNDSDGKITPAELGGVIPDLTIEQFRSFDKNGNGSLNKAEYDAIRRRLF